MNESRCLAPHPDRKYWSRVQMDMLGRVCETAELRPHVWCTREAGHDGDHMAFAFSISTPERWPAEVEAAL